MSQEPNTNEDPHIRALLGATAEGVAAIEELLFIIRNAYGSEIAVESDRATQQLLSTLGCKDAEQDMHRDDTSFRTRNLP